MRIRICKSDIEKGIINNCRKCPIARALARTVFNRFGYEPPDVYVRVFQMGWLNPGSGWYTKANLPGVASEFIRNFDAGRPCQPFSFSVKI